jgi:hypothetical protein
MITALGVYFWDRVNTTEIGPRMGHWALTALVSVRVFNFYFNLKQVR